ncbi:tetratricopeptide repeat protein [Desulfolithobacter sp.]
MHVFLRFNKLPKYRLVTSGKRLELLLLDTITAKNISPLKEDDRLIKMLIRRQDKNTSLSFYFRYPPDKTEATALNDNSIALSIQPGSPLTASYRDLATKIPGLVETTGAKTDYTNPVKLSEYASDWQSFFSEYESPVTIKPDPVFTLPPFPLARHVSPVMNPDHWLPEDTKSYAAEEKWNQAAEVVREKLDQQPDVAVLERLLLTYAELQVRGGKYTEPYQLLQQLMYTWPDTKTALLAKYLFIYLQAEHEDPHLAWYDLKKLKKNLQTIPKLHPYFIIFQAELALVTGRVEQAEKILARDDVAFTGRAQLLRLLRQADTRYMRGKQISALVSYLQLLDRSRIISGKPMSLAMFADALYTHYRYQEATTWYKKLAALLNDKPGQDLAMFRLGMSRLHSGEPPQKIKPVFQEIKDAFPGKEGKFRAWLKLTDLDYLSGRKEPVQLARTYADLAGKAPVKVLREEALFKEALVYALTGNQLKAVETAMKKLREFRSGMLNLEARALLIQYLPGVLDKLISQGSYVKALVLARENRELFTRGWLGTEVLDKLGQAYTRLGLPERAARVYLYLLEVSPESQRRKHYLPLLQSLEECHRYDLLEDYADQYTLRYPEGPELTDIFLLRLEALAKQGKLKKAEQILDSDNWPKNSQTIRAAASVYFDLKRFDKVIELLQNPLLDPNDQEPEQVYQLAESLYRTGRMDQAKELFLILAEGDKHREESLFRLAQIYEKKGKMEKALNELQRLAEETNDPLWRKAAREEIDLLQMPPIQ